MAQNFFDSLWSYFAYDLAIDLGTANCMVYVKNKGIVIREPSAIAQHKKTKKILAIGQEAKRMVGKTPANILTVRPLREGVISDFDVAEAMLRYFIQKVHQSPLFFRPRIPRPRVVIGIPSGVTEVERKAVIDAALKSGARKVYLIEEPMAAAIGANLPILEPQGCMIVDIGGGTSEMAVISLGGVVVARSLRVAGDKIDSEIVSWAKRELNLLIGERTAEEVKIEIGCAWPITREGISLDDGREKKTETSLRGRDLKSGLPREVRISSEQVREAIQRPLTTIVQSIRQTIEEIPPELTSDILKQGIVLAGGSSLLWGIDRLIASEVKLPVIITDDPQTAVVRGCAKVLDEMDLLEKINVMVGK